MSHVYASLDQLKAFLTGGNYGTGRDASLLTLLESSSRAVDAFCNRDESFAANLADLAVATALDGSVSDTVTALVVDAVTDMFVGQMLRIDDEDVQITAIDEMSLGLTVLRGMNGTDAAAHTDNTVVNVFRYPAAVVDATVRVAQRRWKARDAGLTGDFGGGPTIPVTSFQDTEMAILKATVGHLRYVLVA